MISRKIRTVLYPASLLAALAVSGSVTGFALLYAEAPGKVQVSTDRLISIAKTYERQGRYDQAATIYEAIIAREPDHAEANRGIEQLMSGRVAPTRGTATSNPRGPAPNSAVAPQPTGDLTPAPAPVVVEVVQPRAVAARHARVEGARPVPVVAPQTVPTVVAQPAPAPEPEFAPVGRPAPVQAVPTPAQNGTTASKSPEPTDSPLTAQPANGPAGQPQVAVSASETPQAAGRPSVEPQRANPFDVQPSQSEPAEDRISPVSQSKQEDAPATSFKLAPTTRQLRPSSKLAAFDVELLDQWAEAPEKYIDPLIRLLKNSEPEKRCYAVFLLGRAGKGASQALPDLRRELRIETGAMARVRIAESIYRIHGPDDASLKELLDQLKNGEVNIRCTAARVLAIAHDSPRLRFVIENLADSLRDEDTTVGRAAAYTLATFGENSRLILPDLFDAAKSIDPNLRAAARTAISKIDPDLVLPEEEK